MKIVKNLPLSQTNPISLDDGVCRDVEGGGVIIDPAARPIRWLPFSLVASIAFLTAFVWLLTFFAILSSFSIFGLISWLLKMLILSGLLGGLLLSLYPQWKALRMPVVLVNSRTGMVELIRAHSIRRIPFHVVRDMTTRRNPITTPVDLIINRILDRLDIQRYGVGLVLKHGEIVWCGNITADDSQDRAQRIESRIRRVMTG
jgi:hypothetical protein